VTIFPQPASSAAAYAATGGLVLALIVLANLLIFRVSVPHRSPPPPPAPAKARLNDGQSLALIRQDLIDLKRRFVTRRFVMAEVDHSGSESRVFKYFRDLLVPEDDCPGLARLGIKAADPARGFRVEAVCLNRDGRIMDSGLVMTVEWTPRSAVAGFSGYPGSAEIEM
jgi:hypothetical protein